MNLSKEHQLALKIAGILLFFAFFLAYFFPYYNHFMTGNTGVGMGSGMMGNNYNSRYVLFILLAFVVYIFAYFLAKVTIAPIEDNNKKLKEYNHNLAHEIKTPLSVIKSNLELLEMGYDKDLIKSSSDEVKIMQDIIDGLLFLSEKTNIIEKQEVSVFELVQKYKNELIEVNINDDFIIIGNKILLDRMIKNLIENALKYNIGNNKIYINITKKYFEIKNSTSLILSSDEKEKLFDTMYQAENSRNGKGYGLGLSIVKKIVTLHGLNINLNVEKGFFLIKISLY
ncbi:MAG: HAMP domain-containing sensor histidine kinase [Candidatus Gracilibacteria bacterium]|nr:HAMP domain-containing sensor histidine kinase [Candidatus Gracilibacteria bacterium]